MQLPIPEVTVQTTYCLLCRWSNYILQLLDSESCHQKNIAITLLNRDISGTPLGMYSSETEQNEKTYQKYVLTNGKELVIIQIS